MKIVVIHGSPRKGNTYKATTIFLDNMRKYGDIELSEFFLPTDMPYFCCGCKSCFLKGEEFCPHFKSMKPIVHAMCECDGIILTSPVYFFDITGGLKALLDHLSYMVLLHRPRLFGKKATVITTSTGSYFRRSINTMKKALKFLGINKIFTYKLSLNKLDWNDLSYKKRMKAEKTLSTKARDFYAEIVYNQTPNLSLTSIVLLKFIKKIIRKYDDSSLDKKYWYKHGWLKDDTKFIN